MVRTVLPGGMQTEGDKTAVSGINLGGSRPQGQWDCFLQLGVEEFASEPRNLARFGHRLFEGGNEGFHSRI